MESETMINLTSAEISCLWQGYMVDSLAACVLKHFLNTAQDKEVAPVVEYALSRSQSHLQRITQFFNDENFPVPQGFTDSDINTSAPRLFSDNFYLFYLISAGKAGLNAYSLALPSMARSDIREYFTMSLQDSAEVYNRAASVLLSKGLYLRPPYLAFTKKVDFIKKDSFLSGLVGSPRSLLGVEITHLHANILTNLVGRKLITAFAQVVDSKQVRDFFLRGKNMATEHIGVFAGILNKEDIPSPISWDTSITDSRVAPFSDKLMMYHILSIIGSGIGNYAAAMIASLRHDIHAQYSRLSAEVANYSADGLDIMIENAWMEQPPQAINHEVLARS